MPGRKFFLLNFTNKKSWQNMNKHLELRVKGKLVGEDFDKILNDAKIFVS